MLLLRARWAFGMLLKLMVKADEQLRHKVKLLMEANRLSQAQLAQRLDRSQPWLSRRLTGVQQFRIGDLDRIATVFEITIPELFFDTFGQWDRRSKSDRRKGERRQRQRTIYDPRLEVTPEIGRVAFDDK